MSDLTKEEFQSALNSVMSGILAHANEKRKQSDSYKNLFQKVDGVNYQGMFDGFSSRCSNGNRREIGPPDN